MKKYLIDEDLLRVLSKGYKSGYLFEKLQNLTPIKPLTDADLCEVMQSLGITVYGPAAEAVEALTRAVEQRHFGSDLT
jgi:hypothetical protein